MQRVQISIAARLALCAVAGCVIMNPGAVAQGPTRWVQTHNILPPEGEDEFRFGYQLAASGDHAIVTSFRQIDTHHEQSVAHVYDLNSGLLVRTFVPPQNSNNNGFALAIALHDAQAVMNITTEPGGLHNAGAVYVHDIMTGELIHFLRFDEPQEYDGFGAAVGINEHYIAVASREATLPDNRGALYIYDATTAALRHRIRPLRNEPDGDFGTALAMDGDLILVGADGQFKQSGRSYVYHMPTGELVTRLDPPNPRVKGAFGRAVALREGRALVGAPYWPAEKRYGGAAFLYDAASGDLLHEFRRDVGQHREYFGDSVALGGGLAVIGASFWEGEADGMGRVDLYDLGSFEAVQALTDVRGNPFGHFGTQVAMDANSSRLVVSAERDRSEPGAYGSIFVYEQRPVTLVLEVEGACPGTTEVQVSHATPFRQVALLYGTNLGNGGLRSHLCPQLVIDLRLPLHASAPLQRAADEAGQVRVRTNLPPEVCGDLYVQAIDVSTCEVSNLVHIK